jgi:two-component system sensor histidine kinase VicK
LDDIASRVSLETTEVLYGNENIIKRTLETFSWIKERLEGSFDNAGPAIHVIYEPIWDGLVRLKKTGVKIRAVTEITPDNVSYCKKLMEVCELRHLDGVRTNFAIADGKQALLHGVSQETNPLSQAILTSAKALVEAQEYLFENLWKSAIPAQHKIMEIEEGIKPPFMETLRDPVEIQKIGVDLVKSAKQEIQMLLLPADNNNNGKSSNTRLFLTEEHKQVILQLLKIAMLRGIKVRILTSKAIQGQIEKLIEEQQGTTMEKLTDEKNKLEAADGKFEIHFIDRLQQQRFQTKASILVVDSKVCLIEDIKEYKSNDPGNEEMPSLAMYSNRESVVLTYISIFETLCTQTELVQTNR